MTLQQKIDYNSELRTKRREQRENLSPAEKEQARQKERLRKRSQRAKQSQQKKNLQRDNESPSQKKTRQEKNRINSVKYRKKQKTTHQQQSQQPVQDQQQSQQQIIHPLVSIESINNAKNEALKYLHSTQINDTDIHKAPVCVICDMFIIGCETVKWLKSKTLKDHRERLSVEKYKQFYNLQEPLNSEDPRKDLWEYYRLSGFPGMLLSKRARKNDKNEYSCCCNCFNKMRPSSITKKPPKLSIANGFAIGAVPNITWKDDHGQKHTIDVEENVTDVTKALIAPIRTHGYVMAFTGGAHKSIQGHYQFFETDATTISGSLNHIQHTHKKQHVYCMMSGRLTPNQRRRINEECKVDLNTYKELTKWFIERSGHPGFQQMTIPEECPQPVIIQDEQTTNNTEASRNPNVEDRFEGASYFFSSAQDPRSNTSVYESERSFKIAMLNDSSPKLLVYGGKYAKEIEVENLLPFAFPFGTGIPKQKRPIQVSFEACLRRYMRLAMRQFMRGDVILVLHHMYARQLSYKSGVMTCRGNIAGQSIGEKISQLTIDDFKSAIDENNHRSDPLLKQLFKSISTSCRVMGHTPEAAQTARRNCFAMQDYFGLNSVFITITPDDECSFRVRLFATADKPETTLLSKRVSIFIRINCFFIVNFPMY